MRRHRAAVPVLLLLSLTVAGCRCGGGDRPPAAGPSGEGPAGAEGASPAGDLVLTGRVRLDGTPPPARALPTQTDPFCAGFDIRDPTVILRDGGLKNVLVTLTGDGLPVREAGGVVTIDQVACMYTPRVSCLAPGQRAEIQNSDPTMHNVHARVGGARGRTLFNRAQMAGAPPIVESFRRQSGSLLRFGCDVHPWMAGWLHVTGDGHCTVTDGDGRFELDGLPPGEYTATFWHERYGEQTARVTVTPEAGGTVEIVYAAE